MKRISQKIGVVVVDVFGAKIQDIRMAKKYAHPDANAPAD